VRILADLFRATAVTLFTALRPLRELDNGGVCYLSIFVGSTVSGRLGALYEHYTAAKFWLIHAAIVSAGGLLLMLLAPWLRRELPLQPLPQAASAR